MAWSLMLMMGWSVVTTCFTIILACQCDSSLCPLMLNSIRYYLFLLLLAYHDTMLFNRAHLNNSVYLQMCGTILSSLVRLSPWLPYHNAVVATCWLRVLRSSCRLLSGTVLVPHQESSVISPAMTSLAGPEFCIRATVTPLCSCLDLVFPLTQNTYLMNRWLSSNLQRHSSCALPMFSR